MKERWRDEGRKEGSREENKGVCTEGRKNRLQSAVMRIATLMPQLLGVTCGMVGHRLPKGPMPSPPGHPSVLKGSIGAEGRGKGDIT
jgi:hypothetical protein